MLWFISFNRFIVDKNNIVIVDVGINHTEKGIVGDVNYENVLSSVKYITPVPGCIGPFNDSNLNGTFSE